MILDFTDEDLKFPTECFFLTTEATRLGFSATIESFKRVKEDASRVREQVRTMEQRVKEAAKNPIFSAQLQLRLKSMKEFQKVNLFAKFQYLSYFRKFFCIWWHLKLCWATKLFKEVWCVLQPNKWNFFVVLFIQTCEILNGLKLKIASF